VTRSAGQAGFISESDLETELVEHRRSGERLASVLVRMNLATERPIAKALAHQLGFSYVDLADHPPDRAAVPLISKEVALKRNCIAIAVGRNVLTVAPSDTCCCSRWSRTSSSRRATASNRSSPRAGKSSRDPPHVSRQGAGAGCTAGWAREPSTGSQPAPVPGALGASVDVGAIRLGRPPDEDVFEPTAANKPATPELAPIIDMVEVVINSALKSRASDTHIEPTACGTSELLRKATAAVPSRDEP
jgi:type IV pilus assembly protein PilB